MMHMYGSHIVLASASRYDCYVFPYLVLVVTVISDFVAHRRSFDCTHTSPLPPAVETQRLSAVLHAILDPSLSHCLTDTHTPTQAHACR